jgi:hypothetical protein
MTITATFFHGTAGWIVAVLAICGAGSILGDTWDSLSPRFRRARPRTGWRVELPDGTSGTVADFYPSVYDQPARVLLEEMTGPHGEHAGVGSWPQAAVVLALDCTRIPRKGFLHVCRSLRQAIREFPSTTSKDA